MIKRNVQVVRGVQATKYDAWLVKFTEPGDSLFFTEEELSKQTASNVARRLTLLDSKKEGRKFHSYYDTIEQMVVVRVRPQEEKPSDDEKEEEPEQKVLSFAEKMALMEEEEKASQAEEVATIIAEPQTVEVNVDFE